MNDKKIKISVNEEDVQNIINCYEKDIKYIERLEHNWNELKKYIESNISIWEDYDWCLRDVCTLIKRKMQKLEEVSNE